VKYKNLAPHLHYMPQQDSLPRPQPPTKASGRNNEYKLTRILAMRNDRKRSKNISVCHVQYVK